MKPTSQLPKLFTEVPKVINGKPRPDVSIKIGEPTAKQQAEWMYRRSRLVELTHQIETLSAQVNKLRDECPHEVCYDIAGWPYDERFCAGCDKSKGSI